ncbi:hypothetical protein QP888_04355 [Corynebacterium sp. MSK297]|uniref:hypothetical protein n=1 Tax=Corynebacterium sp. MSK297 TaxID=3050221 RepID=UPI00254DC80B|nr:hypothetical protein [Corynebacterium sp. MSK297]MDK8845755.1 hypothetical protein [Corynebacterium sp. MSK297]
MTSPQHPQRRLPEEIYRRRRMAGLAVLLLLVLLLVWIFSAIFGGNGEENPQSAADTSAANQTATATAAREEKDGDAGKDSDKDADDAANDSAAKEAEDIEGAHGAKDSDRPRKGDEDKEKSADERPSPYPGEGEEAHATSGACELHDLSVTAHSDKAYYAGGDQPTFYMSVENPTDHDCVVNLDENPLRFEVYDLNTNHRMWADTDCYPAVITGNQEFKAGQTRHFEAVWSKTNSAPGECNHRPATPEGNYFLHAVVGDNASDALTFALRA